ncbi:hypothetical protein IAQ61_001354 [Plenodomus lingam]|uniref:uncharacterized protein n=1 Tax=Leptosphaeria maculans TaxID=5022 RepID=UPI00331B3DE0|nr:hypothetical protein IAQ61_001354 [Plenodomus lingam]
MATKTGLALKLPHTCSQPPPRLGASGPQRRPLCSTSSSTARLSTATWERHKNQADIPPMPTLTLSI